MPAARFGPPDFPPPSRVHWPPDTDSKLRIGSDPAAAGDVGIDDDPDASWISREVNAMAAAWAHGNRVLAAEVIDRTPGIDDEDAVRLIYEEVNLRRESGEEVPTREVLAQYHRYRGELEVLLGCDRLLRPLAGPAELPEVGESLGPFTLKAELGRGASGRTYLATEPTLADRPVVLKVIPDDQEEHLSLARLQHTNIIPLFSEHTFPDRRLRALCMPYLGGANLARVLDALAPIPPADRRGRDLIHVLDTVRASGAPPAPTDGPYRRNLENVSYVDAIVWIGFRLADALNEAHTHGLVHMDVKPSNVLIAADGSPMLLDFHLASRPLAAGERFPHRVGGTPGWMPPEQRAALDAVVAGRPIPKAVDHRADIYALGRLLREALGGTGAADDPRALRVANPGVSVGLDDILTRCLSADPSDRYPFATALADDLRNHLEHRRLVGVRNRSPRESWRKLRLRQPAALGYLAMWITLVGVALMVAVGSAVIGQQAREARAALFEARAYCREGRFSDAEPALLRGLERAGMFPGQARLINDLTRQLRIARRGQRAETLHRLAEQVRFRYGTEPPSGAEATALLRNVRTIWDDRRVLFNRDSAPLDQADEDRIRADLLELVACWADVRIRTAAAADARPAQEEALAILDEARAACGPSYSIDRLRRSAADALGRSSPAPEHEEPPRTAADHYDLGRSLLRDDRFEPAASQFRLSIDERPDDFWPSFYLGRCEYRLGHYTAAAIAFGNSIGLAPPARRAECYFNRALASEALARPDEALRDYSRALKNNPALTAARLNRGILAFKAGRLPESLDDLRDALRSAADRKTQGQIHYNLAIVHLARGDRVSARASADQAIAMGDDRAWDLRDRLRFDAGTAVTSPRPR